MAIYNRRKNTAVPDFKNPEQYVEAKLVVLNDFAVTPTEDELIHLRKQKSEGAIDAACRQIIINHWDK